MTALGPAHSFNAAACAARTGNALAILLAALQNVTVDPHWDQGPAFNCSYQLSQASWERVASDQWVLSTIAHGYQLQFQRPPVNWKKSSIQPRQQVNFLGLHFKSITMEACLTPQRTDGLEKVLSHLYEGKLVTAHRVQKLLGMVIPLALLRTLNTGLVQLFSSSSKKGQKDEAVGDTVLYAGLTQLTRISITAEPH